MAFCRSCNTRVKLRFVQHDGSTYYKLCYKPIGIFIMKSYTKYTKNKRKNVTHMVHKL